VESALSYSVGGVEAWLSAMATNFLGQNNFHIILHLRFGHTM